MRIKQIEYQMNLCKCPMILADRDIAARIICAFQEYKDACLTASNTLNEKISSIIKEIPDEILDKFEAL